MGQLAIAAGSAAHRPRLTGAHRYCSAIPFLRVRQAIKLRRSQTQRREGVIDNATPRERHSPRRGRHRLSGRIGREGALRLTCDGLAVPVCFGSHCEQADTVVAEIRRLGDVVAAQADVADEDALTGVFDHAESEFGGAALVHAVARDPIARLVDLHLAVPDSLHRTDIRARLSSSSGRGRHVMDGLHSQPKLLTWSLFQPALIALDQRSGRTRRRGIFLLGGHNAFSG